MQNCIALFSDIQFVQDRFHAACLPARNALRLAKGQ